MERRTDLIDAEKIMGKNFIGPEQLDSIKDKLGIKSSFQLGLKIPVIPFDKAALEKYSGDYILILGIPKAHDNMPLTINKLRETFGFNPEVKEPCFYNQDWYLNEEFASIKVLDFKWYLLKKNDYDKFRGIAPDLLINEKKNSFSLPTAILCAYTFFSYYFYTDVELLWINNFVWCNDLDHNNDRIYVGRYCDPSGINKRGFNIHRHLSITKDFSFIDEIK